MLLQILKSIRVTYLQSQTLKCFNRLFQSIKTKTQIYRCFTELVHSFQILPVVSFLLEPEFQTWFSLNVPLCTHTYKQTSCRVVFCFSERLNNLAKAIRIINGRNATGTRIYLNFNLVLFSFCYIGIIEIQVILVVLRFRPSFSNTHLHIYFYYILNTFQLGIFLKIASKWKFFFFFQVKVSDNGQEKLKYLIVFRTGKEFASQQFQAIRKYMWGVRLLLKDDLLNYFLSALKIKILMKL